jgi:tRNA (guanine37-N1)-methyltransferase
MTALPTIHLITVHPKIVTAYAAFGVLRAAKDKGIADVLPIDLRDFAVDQHGSVDDKPYGGGDGMVLRVEPLAQAIESLPKRPRVLLTTPAGVPWTQRTAEAEVARLAKGEPLAIICGRFAGVDQRFVDLFVAEDGHYSVGDVVLAGGELPALMMAESMLRLMPGVLGHPDSAAQDSFAAGCGGGLEYPLYTRPPDYRGMGVPAVLTSGDHKAISKWRSDEATRRTKMLRPDLLPKRS